MKPKSKTQPSKPTTTGFHPRNKHQGQYDFVALTQACEALKKFVQKSAYGNDTIDFSDPQAVLCLNKALLLQQYGLNDWQIAAGYLCPPVPGRADYIHHIADLLGTCNKGIIPKGSAIRCLDIGTGANLIYPIIGHQTYGWSFVGSDMDQVAIASAQNILATNNALANHVQLRLQPNAKHIFTGIIQPGDYFDITVCNPPFHVSAKEAREGSLRKLSNLSQQKVSKVKLNFGGQSNELWCEGGETQFVQQMIKESVLFAESCLWFSTLVAKQANLKGIYAALNKAGAKSIKTISMSHGNKISRVVAWSFSTPNQQQVWVNTKWNNNP